MTGAGEGHENGWVGEFSCATVPAMNVDAAAFAERWARNWNAHDVDAVLDDFHEDVVFTSPVAARFRPETQGVVRGKAALRQYWITALGRIPDLRFTVEGVNTTVIAYRNQNDNMVSEVLTFQDNMVVEGHGMYRLSD